MIRLINKGSSLGYAIPGAILGVALMTWVGYSLQGNVGGSITETLFYSSTYGLVIAYSIRLTFIDRWIFYSFH